MLPLEKQVVSLELSKKLKELGVPQESLHYHARPKHVSTWVIYSKEQTEGKELELCSAFTVAGLGEILRKIDFDSLKMKYTKEWENLIEEIKLWKKSTVLEADARAKILIYLLENKLISNP
jgi:hypothetical protein